MAVEILQAPTITIDNIFIVFGTSSGEIEFHRLNFLKKKVYIQKNCTIKTKGSILCMKKL